MADRIFNLPQTRGSFEMAGKVTGTQRSNFYNEKETKSGAMRRVLSFGVQTSNENTFYIDLTGMPRDKVFFKALGSFLGIILIFVATYFISWITTIGIIWLIFKLLNIMFTIKVATGIWLILILLECFIKGSRGK